MRAKGPARRSSPMQGDRTRHESDRWPFSSSGVSRPGPHGPGLERVGPLALQSVSFNPLKKFDDDVLHSIYRIS